eukprot:387899-Hanusia_phi.AAC.1
MAREAERRSRGRGSWKEVLLLPPERCGREREEKHTTEDRIRSGERWRNNSVQATNGQLQEGGRKLCIM